MNMALKDFSNLADAVLDGKALTVLTAMEGNANYPGAATQVTALRVAYNAYHDALSLATYGTPSQKTEKNDRKWELVTALKNVCDYVNFTTPGERAILQTTGLTISSDVRIPVTTEPLKWLKLSPGSNKGSVVATTKKGAGTQSVLIEYAVSETLEDIKSWTSCPGTKSSCIVSGLKPASTVWFRAAAIGPRNQVIYCVPISTIVM